MDEESRDGAAGAVRTGVEGVSVPAPSLDPLLTPTSKPEEAVTEPDSAAPDQAMISQISTSKAEAPSRPSMSIEKHASQVNTLQHPPTHLDNPSIQESTSELPRSNLSDLDINLLERVPTLLGGNSTSSDDAGSSFVSSIAQLPMSWKGKGRARLESMNHILDPHVFQQSEVELLRLENEQLKRQARILASRQQPIEPRDSQDDASASTSTGIAREQSLQSTVKVLQADKELLRRRLKDSNLQRSRLESELKYLRTYLLTNVQPVYATPQGTSFATKRRKGLHSKRPESLPSAIDEDEDEDEGAEEVDQLADGDMQDVQGEEDGEGEADDGHSDRNTVSENATLLSPSVKGKERELGLEEAPVFAAVSTQTATDALPPQSPENPHTPKFSSVMQMTPGSSGRATKRQKEDFPSTSQHNSGSGRRKRSRKSVMGDAEMEHLLLASSRLASIHRILDLHPDSSTPLVPPQDAYSQSAPWPRGLSNHSGMGTGTQQSLGSPIRQRIDRPKDSQYSPPPLLRADIDKDAGKMFMPTPPTSVPTNNTSPPFRSYRPERSRQALSDSPESADQASRHHQRAFSSSFRPSVPATPAKKIGRPLGSPNKSKTISKLDAAILRRKLEAQTGRNDGPAERTDTVFGHHMPSSSSGSMGDLLLAAQMQVTDSQWPEVGQDDGSRDLSTRTFPSLQDRFGGSGSGRTRGTSTPPEITSGHSMAQLPVTPPNMAGRQISALDVLADQAASASKDPSSRPRATSNMSANGVNIDAQISNDSRSVRPTSHYSLGGLEEGRAFLYKDFVNRPPAQSQANHLENDDRRLRASSQPTLAGPRDEEMSGPVVKQEYPAHILGEPFDYYAPNTIQNESQDYSHSAQYQDSPAYMYSTSGMAWEDQTPTSSEAGPSSASRHVPGHSRKNHSFASALTIAQQLSLGVDASHPLVDQNDLAAGMTPAASLAKKSRSPYIKWSLEEDELLLRAIIRFGIRWDFVSKELPNRSYHQCRQRWLRGLKSGDAIPASLRHYRPQIDAAIQAHEQAKSVKKEAEDLDQDEE